MNKNKLKNLLKSQKGFAVERDNSDELITKEFIKLLRKKLGFTQVVFASAFGVSVKTVEKWEQGVIEPRAIVKKFLMIIYEKPYLVNEFYNYTFEGKKYYPASKQEYLFEVILENITKPKPKHSYSTDFKKNVYISKHSKDFIVNSYKYIN